MPLSLKTKPFVTNVRCRGNFFAVLAYGTHNIYFTFNVIVAVV